MAEIKTGKITPESDVGWVLISDYMACVRTVRDFLIEKPKKGQAGRE